MAKPAGAQVGQAAHLAGGEEALDAGAPEPDDRRQLIDQARGRVARPGRDHPAVVVDKVKAPLIGVLIDQRDRCPHRLGGARHQAICAVADRRLLVQPVADRGGVIQVFPVRPEQERHQRELILGGHLGPGERQAAAHQELLAQLDPRRFPGRGLAGKKLMRQTHPPAHRPHL
jgi:hypothetical protein